MKKQTSHPTFPFKNRTRQGHQEGFTLIEILVTMFILAVGLLGLASLLLEGMRNNQGAYLRTQASILAYDIADRMRANSSQASAYAPFTTKGASTTMPSCASQATGCSPSDHVGVDKAEWTRRIQGVGSDMELLPSGFGTIAFDAGTSTFTVTVQWQEVTREGDAGEEITGDGAYSVRFSL
jgi:type IV pilus assembly protein PilV